MRASTILAPSSVSLPSPFARRRLLSHARSHATALALALAALLVVGDYVTGIDLAFTLLYAAPIGIAAWWRGRALGLAVAAFCVAGATVSEIVLRMQHGWPLHPWRMVWNHGGSLVLFGLGILLTVRLRAYTDEAERSRRATVEQLRQAERLGIVGKLASGLAHELGTPLNVILGHAELLDSDRLTRSMVMASSTAITAQAERMTTIIRGLLDFSRRAGREKSDIDLGSLAHAATEFLRPVASKKGVDIVVSVQTNIAAVVHANPTELEQVLVNLIMNGIQAMPEGGTLHVRVHRPRDVAAERGDSAHALVCLEVEDQGVGIAPETLPKIFDPFFTTKDVGEGTGLGLSVSYGIVSDHGGRIQVTSVIGSGSRFSVYLPLAHPSR